MRDLTLVPSPDKTFNPPALIKELNLVIPEPIELPWNASYNEVLKADIQIFNASLKIMHALWGKVESLPAAVRMIQKTLDMLKVRRELMGLAYGAPQARNSQTFTYEPLD